VIVADANSATAMMPIARRRPVIYNAHNFEPDYVINRIGNDGLARAMRRRYERKLIGVAAETWMVSRVDVDSARELVPGASVRYVPNVVDVSAIAPKQIEHPAAGTSGTELLMVGDFTYQPNRSGRDLLAHSVLPLVWQSLPEVRVKIAGRATDEWQAPDPRIEVVGFVDSLAGLYAQADCVVVPITEGAGSPVKFVEALAYGVPVIATPKAARGLDVVAGVHYREGGDATTLAQAIVEVLRDGGAEMAAAARQLAEREHSIESLAERIAA
jgi:glycosyltransferase involved in cell wall biosynthesis